VNRNAPTVAALGAALTLIAGLAFLSLAGRDERAPTLPDDPLAPATASNARHTTHEPLLDVPARTTLSGPDRRDVGPTAAQELFAFHGRVRAKDGQPVVAADVRVTLLIGDAERFVLGETVTGPDGTYTLESATPLGLAPARRALGLVALTASAVGYRPSTVETGLATDEDTQAIDVVLDAGGRLTGRVLDVRGVPVDGARASLVVAGSLPGRDELSLVHETTTDTNGLFELGFLSGGEVVVHVRASGVGSARVDDLRVEAGADTDLGDITLAGTGILGGRVTYPGGDPARTLELWAVPEALADRAHALALARRGTLAREEGVGLTLDRTHTGDDGSFRFTGLAEGRYTILTEHKEQQLAPLGAVHATGSQSVTLVLGSRRLRIAVRASDNRPLPGARVTLTPLAEDERGTRVSGPAQHAVARGEGASCDFEVPAGTPLAIRVTAPDCHAVDERIVFASGERERLHTVVLYPASTSGTIRLDVRDERGEPFENLRVWVLAESSGIALLGFDGIAPDENNRVGPLPPGRYGLAVWPQAATSGDNLSSAFPVEATTPVEVTPNAETFVALVARSGGHVRLTVSVPHGSELALDPDEENYGALTRRRRTARRLRQHGAQATFVDEDEHQLPVHFQTAGGLEMLLLPGTTGLVNDLLECGIWTVRVEAPGFAPSIGVVTVEPGGVTDVTIALVPE